MPIVVQKYGGSSVADVERVRQVADKVAATKAQGRDVVVVVSAMGDTTDDLLALARQVCESPSRRELDMLLSAGERISMALLSMALNARGVPAVSFTGSQSGIVTNDAHANARIVEVRPFRVQDELDRGRVVIVAGYQGVSYKKEVTTLGRGGSDTTAVALAAALGADCEIYSDVAGVYTADPRVVKEARRLPSLAYEEMQELAEAGARVLNAQAVEFAKERGIAIYARATRGGGETVVRQFPPRMPGRVVGVASETGLVLLTTGTDSGPQLLLEVLALLDERQAPGKQLLYQDWPARGGAGSLVLSLENVHDFRELRRLVAARFDGRVELREGIGAVSAIGAGINATFRNLRRACEVAQAAGATPLGVSTSGFRISLLVEQALVPATVHALHRELVTEGEPVEDGRA
ncbi:MAG TPA: aspartate kinase [Vicinamibacteria bacterium]|nr:aspartate kinase [Vicinamibacteria bacterium]